MNATNKAFETLQSSVDSFFTTQGFQKDNQNTLILQSAPPFITLGYTKDTVRCLITLVPNVNPFGDFFCGTVDQLQMTWRKELTPAINPTNDPNVDVSVEKLVGNYATGGVGDYSHHSGAVWYAVKVDGQWKKVWEGQNTISCTPVKQYAIPKDIYGNTCSTAY